MNKKARYTVNDILNNRFYQMPKFLFENEFKKGLSNDAKVLYSLLRDRHDLSIVNNWINEKGEVFLIYTRENMADMVGVSQPTLRKAIQQLKYFGLMEEERIGLNKANRIYLTAIEIETTGLKNSFSPECKNFSVQSVKLFQSREKESFSLKRKDFSFNDTNTNNTDKNNDTKNNQSINQQKYKKYPLEFIREKLEIETLEIENTLYKELGEIIYDVLNYNKETLKINGQQLDIDIVKNRFLKLNSNHLQYVVDTFSQQKNKIKNIKNYLITALYNSYTTLESYYTNQANYDLHN